MSRKLENPDRGSYRRSVQTRTARVAVDATLRAAALNIKSKLPFSIGPDSVRYKLFARKSGGLFIFAIDTSGSMALNRINQAKGALLQLLKRSYVNRDRVAVVAFRGTEAKVLLPPSRSILRARRVLDGLSVGGGTPLAAALSATLELVHLEKRKQNSETVLLVFTDGRVNVPLKKLVATEQAKQREQIQNEIASLGADLKSSGVKTVVVETQNQYLPNQDASRLAKILLAQHVRVSNTKKYE
jgi:magnesium chelatase subunit D